MGQGNAAATASGAQRNRLALTSKVSSSSKKNHQPWIERVINYAHRTHNIDISNQKLDLLPYDIKTFIKHKKQFFEINLSGNSFTHLPPVFLKKRMDYSELTSLDLSCNKLEEIPPGVLSRCAKLRRLLIAHNSFKVFPIDDLKKLSRLIVR